MAAEENRIENLRALVNAEAKSAGGKLRMGYRAVASCSGLDEEYIYQLYKGIKKKMGPDAARAIARAYANKRPLSWFDMAIIDEAHSSRADTTSPTNNTLVPSITLGMTATPSTNQSTTLADTLARLGALIKLAGPDKRDNLVNLFSLLVRSPDNPLYAKAIEAELTPGAQFETNHHAGLPPPIEVTADKL